MRRALAILVTGLFVGTLAGFALGRGTAPVSVLPAPAVSSQEREVAAVERPPEVRAPATKPVIVSAPCVTTAEATKTALIAPTPVDVPTLAAENALLRTEFERLKSNATTLETARVLEEGLPLQPPPAMDQRFGGDVLREGVTRAISEAGFGKGQITSIDCTEYPCIVYGEGFGGREDFQKLNGTNALQAYANDSHSGSGWAVGRNPDGSPKHQYFAFAVYTADERQARGELLSKRIQYRTRQMAETFPSD